MDRLREIDEDNAIEDHMSSYAAVKTDEPVKKGFDKILRRKKKKKKDKSNGIDVDKDIDTSETKEDCASPKKSKKKSAKKKILSLASKKLTFPHSKDSSQTH